MEIDLDHAISLRQSYLAAPRPSAFRLFDGFREGFSENGPIPIVLEIYGDTLVVFDHGKGGEDDEGVAALVAATRNRLPFLRAGIVKHKRSEDPEARRGRLLFGETNEVARRIEENGVRFAIDLRAHHDASFFLDTRLLRSYLAAESKQKRVLNAFAYSCSLGVAALAGGARQVVNTDKNRGVLNLGKDSYSLNGFPIQRAEFIAADFFDVAARFRKANELYDTVIVDPPFFADGGGGRVDVVNRLGALLAKARPLVAHNGLLIVVVNALFISGETLMNELDAMVADGYAAIERLVLVPPDCAPPLAPGLSLPAEPAPFNHSTKIALVRLRRKDERAASG